MGVAANQARLMTLTARQADLELRAQSISAIKMRLAMQQQGVATEYSKALDAYAKAPNATDAETALNAATAAYDSAISSLAAQEKQYDLELTQVNTEHTAIKTEYDSIKSLIGDNVEKSFNVFG